MAAAPAGERRTKIVATIGPASSAPEELKGLIESGMDVVRLNFSHGDRGMHAAVLTRVRALAERLGVPLAVLQDLAGPKVRVGPIAGGSITLEAGQPFVLTTAPVDGTRERASVSYAGLPGAVAANDTLLLADGSIALRVENVAGDEIRCRVVVGGRLTSRKGVNVPSGLPDLPILGDKDLEDLRFGLERRVDYVGLSFVRTADDVRWARAYMASLGAEVPIVAKIETQSALDHFEEILEVADAIMIARGDLSIETPFARVPIVQKQLIASANRRARPVITATQMLFSMVESPQPTRAEVADVANAVADGSDAVMLSEETAIGRHAARAVQIMAVVTAETERGLRGGPRPAQSMAEPARDDRAAIVQAACQLADDQAVALIVTVTRTGETARFAARCRPAQPILAFTDRPDTYRRLSLVRGVAPRLLPDVADLRAESLEQARRLAREHGWQGQRAVVVADDRVWVGSL
jgi:pyruvate kinase